MTSCSYDCFMCSELCAMRAQRQVKSPKSWDAETSIWWDIHRENAQSSPVWSWRVVNPEKTSNLVILHFAVFMAASWNSQVSMGASSRFSLMSSNFQLICWSNRMEMSSWSLMIPAPLSPLLRSPSCLHSIVLHCVVCLEAEVFVFCMFFPTRSWHFFTQPHSPGTAASYKSAWPLPCSDLHLHLIVPHFAVHRRELVIFCFFPTRIWRLCNCQYFHPAPASWQHHW